MTTNGAPPRAWDRARFYTIVGQQLPSVTTILEVINKPALGPCTPRRSGGTSKPLCSEILSRPGARDPEYVLGAVADAVTGVKAADRAKQQAATIGTAIHAGIEWTLRTQLGEDAGAEPRLPDAAAWAVESWKDWAKHVALEPLAIEHTVYCEICGYAGTLDLYARVQGVLTVLDWKSGKAIYPEAFLQNAAYRHAAQRLGMPADQGLIVRLPKLIGDPAWEVMTVPETVSVSDFLAAANLWRWQRRMGGQPEGDRFAPPPPEMTLVRHHPTPIPDRRTR